MSNAVMNSWLTDNFETEYTFKVEYPQFVANKAKANFRLWASPDQVHAITGAVTEVGELADLFKKASYKEENVTRERIIDEVGDVLWYLQLMLNTVGADFGDAIAANMAKLNARYAAKLTASEAATRDTAKETLAQAKVLANG